MYKRRKKNTNQHVRIQVPPSHQKLTKEIFTGSKLFEENAPNGRQPREEDIGYDCLELDQNHYILGCCCRQNQHIWSKDTEEQQQTILLENRGCVQNSTVHLQTLFEDIADLTQEKELSFLGKATKVWKAVQESPNRLFQRQMMENIRKRTDLNIQI